MSSLANAKLAPQVSEAQLTNSPASVVSVAEIAERLQLKPLKAKGKTEYHGANPTGGAEKDGFILFAEGNALDRKTEARFTSREVAAMAGVDPANYEPCTNWRASNGSQSDAQPLGATGTPTAPRNAPSAAKDAKGKPTESVFHNYTTDAGEVLFRVNRKKFADGSKEFPVSRPDGRGGFAFGLGDVEPVLYDLPRLKAAQTVFVVEGEKCADALNAAFVTDEIGHVYAATTAPFGAGKWRPSYSQALTGKRVFVLPDNDEPGERHGAQVCAGVFDLASSVALLRLPGLPEKGDVLDFLNAGNTVETLCDLMPTAPVWTPEKAPQLPEPQPTETPSDAPSAAPMFPVLSYKQLRARPRLSWLIDRVLAVGGTSWLTATSGHFKSFWAIDAALCIATGRRFHGREVKRGNVVYLAAEGAVGLPDRIDAWAAKHQTEVPDAPAFGIIERSADVATPAVLAGLVASVRALEPAFIVLDTQARCSVGRDLDKTAEASVFYDAVCQLARELGAHILILAHNNRSGQYAGNHQGPAMADTHLSLKREGKRAQLRCLKQKDGAAEEEAAMDFETLVFELDGRDERGRPITSLALQSVELSDEPDAPQKPEPGAEIQAQVLEVLRRDFPKGARASEWKDKCIEAGICKRTAFFDARDALLKRGQIGHVAGVYLPKELHNETSPPSPPSPPTDFNGLEPPALKSASPPSPPPVGGLADCGLRTNTTKRNEPPKTQRATKRAVVDSEPYASARNGS